MSAAEFERRHEQAKEILRKTGAHYATYSLMGLPPVIDDINTRLSRGEQPQYHPLRGAGTKVPFLLL